MECIKQLFIQLEGLTGPVSYESILLPGCTFLFNMLAHPFRSEGQIHLPG